MPSLMISPFQMASLVNNGPETHYNLSNQEDMTKGDRPTHDVTSSQISNIDHGRGPVYQDPTSNPSPFGTSARMMQMQQHNEVTSAVSTKFAPNAARGGKTTQLSTAQVSNQDLKQENVI